MKMHVISSPCFMQGEESFISELIDAGIDVFHLRKPHCDINDYRKLLDGIPDKYLSRIVIHEHFELFHSYPLMGIHLNGRCNTIPDDFHGSLSKSCHSLKEIESNITLYDFVFLSPVFNSISKPGYLSNFSSEQLDEAAANGVINEKVIALGGINVLNHSELAKYHFGGFAVLGDIWNNIQSPDFNAYLKQYFI